MAIAALPTGGNDDSGLACVEIGTILAIWTVWKERQGKFPNKFGYCI